MKKSLTFKDLKEAIEDIKRDLDQKGDMIETNRKFQLESLENIKEEIILLKEEQNISGHIFAFD